jgi:hypothetical protein
VGWLEREGLENQEVQGALDEICGFAHMPRPSTTWVWIVDDLGIKRVPCRVLWH